jgi:spermidine/putrescine-binding protein
MDTIQEVMELVLAQTPEKEKEQELVKIQDQVLVKAQQFDDLFRKSYTKQLKSLKVAQLEKLTTKLSIERTKEGKKMTKAEMTEKVLNELTKMGTKEIIAILKQTNTGFAIEVKDLLDNDVDIGQIIESGICARLDQFLEAEPSIKARFVNTCDLLLVNDTVTSKNCAQKEVQGLYLLTIEKDGVAHIVKMGSFAETQGMAKRITSFGGGCYETGSLTNKWFQRFMKKALSSGYTCKFTYYENEEQTAITTTDLDGNSITMMPYVMRPKETQLFDKYNNYNNNIPPIFGSNCSQKAE